jgi:FixJ family two-component response regulator
MSRLVAVVDDDISVRESLESLIRSVGMQVKLFASAEEFLSAAQNGKADCLVLDVRLPGMSGLELHRYLLGQNYKLPAIFITAHASDDRARLEARSDWTVAYLSKPFGEDEFVDAVAAALKWKPHFKTN